MGVQAMILKNRWLANQFMSRTPASFHVRRGEKQALETARTARTRTHAYPDYLATQGMRDLAMRDMSDFRNLPVIDKAGYVDQYPLDDLCLDGELTTAYTIEKSSGHAGTAYYWLRLPKEDELFPSYLEFAMRQWYGAADKATLILITLALGTWTSGEKFGQAMRMVAATGKYRLTIMTPGTNLEEILEICADLGHFYDRVILIGYPPFVKSVIDEGSRRGIDWKSMSMKLALGGESYSEQWREHMATLIGVDSRKDLLAISGGYGAADLGMSVGREYAITVMIRKLCMDDPELAEALFKDSRGRNGVLPALVQYDPTVTYIEQIDGELVFTVLSGIPLVRYNIHDSGGIVPFTDMIQALHDHGYDIMERLAEIGYGRQHVWQLPFFYVFGRSDGTVSIVGANIFPENVQAVLSEAGDREILTFRLAVRTTDSYSQRLAIALEHHSFDLSERDAAALAEHYRPILVEGLRRMNPDFRDAYEDHPECADPIITVHPRENGPFSKRKRIKNQYIDG